MTQDRWNYEETPVTAQSWVRSWRQELYTDLGSDFSLVAHMERVTVLPSGAVHHEPLPEIRKSMSSVIGDPRVQNLSALLTELIGEWSGIDAAPEIVDEAVSE